MTDFVLKAKHGLQNIVKKNPGRGRSRQNIIEKIYQTKRRV